MNSVKNKIRLGTIFLFVLLLLSGGFSIYYLVKVRLQSKNILTANYESLEYSHRMQRALDSLQAGNTAFIDSFNKQLSNQEANITEAGEGPSTLNLRRSFSKLQHGDSSSAQDISFALQKILDLNMQAIKTKSEKSEAGAQEALTFLIAIIVVIFIIGFTFVYNFPSIITTPIQKLTDAIKAIGAKDYKHRIHIESKDEFGKMADAFNEMAERLEYFESSNLNKLIFEKTRAEAVINSLKDASIGIDKADIILFANNQALSFLGMQAKDIIGKPVAEVSSRNDLFRFLLDDKGNVPFKIVVDNKENFFTKELIEVPQDENNSRVIVLRNITSFKELDVAKTNFIATVSHELKTPLASSDFSLKLLEDERVSQLSAEQKDLVQHLKADNRRMLRILSELLNMSQVEAGKIQLNLQEVAPALVIENSLNAIVSVALEKNIAVVQNVNDNLPPIQLDADKVSWVLNNFLTNAIRYAPSETEVVIAVVPANKWITFSVTDKGPGIEEQYLNKIFERYFQIPGRSDKKGSGIGLAICKDFIEAMGGRIWVKSQVGEGSTFGFDLPAA